MMSSERYPQRDDDYDGGGFQYTPAPRVPKLPRCKHCPDREVISDGYGGYVHEDDYKYACDINEPGGTFAEAKV